MSETAPPAPTARLQEVNRLSPREWSDRWLGLEIHCRELEEAIGKIYLFAARWHQNTGKSHLILSGETGSGKTMMAEGFHRWVKAARFSSWEDRRRAAPPRVEWVEFSQLATLDNREFARWLDEQRGVDLLFLEDAGAEVDRFKSQETAERFRQLLNEFKNRWLFITTNIPREKWARVWDARVEDRLYRASVIVDLTGVKPYSMRTEQK